MALASLDQAESLPDNGLAIGIGNFRVDITNVVHALDEPAGRIQAQVGQSSIRQAGASSVETHYDGGDSDEQGAIAPVEVVDSGFILDGAAAVIDGLSEGRPVVGRYMALTADEQYLRVESRNSIPPDIQEDIARNGARGTRVSEHCDDSGLLERK